MDLEATLTKAESYLNESKENMDLSVFNLLSELCRSERQYIQMVRSWSAERVSDKEKRMKKSWEAYTK